MRADHLAVAEDRQGNSRSDPGPAGQRGAAAIAQLAQVVDVDQVALPPGPAVEPFPLAKPGGAGMPLKLVVDPTRLEREDQGMLRRIDRPVRRVGPAELLANRIQRAADHVVDRPGPDDRGDRVDHRLGVGQWHRSAATRRLGAVEQCRRRGTSAGRCHRLSDRVRTTRSRRTFDCAAARLGFSWGGVDRGPHGRFASGGNALVDGLGASGSMGMVDVAKGGMSGIRIDPCQLDIS